MKLTELELLIPKEINLMWTYEELIKRFSEHLGSLGLRVMATEENMLIVGEVVQVKKIPVFKKINAQPTADNYAEIVQKRTAITDSVDEITKRKDENAKSYYQSEMAKILYKERQKQMEKSKQQSEYQKTIASLKHAYAQRQNKKEELEQGVLKTLSNLFQKL